MASSSFTIEVAALPVWCYRAVGLPSEPETPVRDAWALATALERPTKGQAVTGIFSGFPPGETGRLVVHRLGAPLRGQTILEDPFV